MVFYRGARCTWIACLSGGQEYLSQLEKRIQVSCSCLACSFSCQLPSISNMVSGQVIENRNVEVVHWRPVPDRRSPKQEMLFAEFMKHLPAVPGRIENAEDVRSRFQKAASAVLPGTYMYANYIYIYTYIYICIHVYTHTECVYKLIVT